jgi:hypothetical protein
MEESQEDHPSLQSPAKDSLRNKAAIKQETIPMDFILRIAVEIEDTTISNQTFEKEKCSFRFLEKKSQSQSSDPLSLTLMTEGKYAPWSFKYWIPLRDNLYECLVSKDPRGFS